MTFGPSGETERPELFTPGDFVFTKILRHGPEGCSRFRLLTAPAYANQLANLFYIALDAASLLVFHQVSVFIKDLNLIVPDDEAVLYVVQANRVVRCLLVDGDLNAPIRRQTSSAAVHAAVQVRRWIRLQLTCWVPAEVGKAIVQLLTR